MGSPRPAKSVRKLTTPIGVSKKFWPAGERAKGALSEAHRVLFFWLTNPVAGGVCFFAGYQTHDHRDSEQHSDADSDVQGLDLVHQPLFFGRWARDGWRGRRRRVLCRQHRLRILQPLERVVVLRIDL